MTTRNALPHAVPPGRFACGALDGSGGNLWAAVDHARHCDAERCREFLARYRQIKRQLQEPYRRKMALDRATEPASDSEHPER